MSRRSCYQCPFFCKLKSEEKFRNYCADRDCTVDPNEPPCYDN